VRSLSLKGENKMYIYVNAIETERAFILFKNIQHISWAKVSVNDYEVKIYSTAQVIIQPMSDSDLASFLEHYKEHMGVTL
tara:strand:+ start:1910 stop:2149 length:240 start_codon:yes stop_codon:yes gene_type:complete